MHVSRFKRRIIDISINMIQSDYSLDGDVDKARVLSFGSDVDVRYVVSPAYLQGVVSDSEQAAGNFLANFFIQSWFPMEKMQGNFGAVVRSLPGMFPHQWERLGLVGKTREVFSSEFYGASDILNFVIGELANDRYVLAWMDDGYLPHSWDYGQLGNFHKILIHGYDIARREFLAAGYGRKDYRVYRVDFSSFVRSIGSQGERHLGEGRSGGKLLAFRPKLETFLEINPSRIRRSLVDYLNCELSPKDYGGDQMSGGKGFAGLDVFDACIEYFERFVGGEVPLDLRITRFLWEHKKVMRKRLTVLSNVLGIDFSSHLEKSLNCIETEAWKLHVNLFALEQKQSNSFRDGFKRDLGSLKKLEESAIEEIVAAMD